VGDEKWSPPSVGKLKANFILFLTCLRKGWESEDSNL
jgi:hypothetical protein